MPTMNSWKDPNAYKLSHLLSGRPALPEFDVDSSVCRPLKPQALPLAEDESSFHKRSAFSSFFLSLLRATCSGVGQAVCSGSQGSRMSPSDSHYRSCKSISFDTPLENTVGRRSESSSGITNGVIKVNISDDPERCASSADAKELPSSVDSIEVLPYLTEKSTFASLDLFDFLQSCLPNIVKGCQWILLYSTMKHGISLQTLIRRSASLSGPCLLIVGDMQGAVFGGLLDTPLKPTTKRKYQGSNQAFVFTTIYGQPRLFRATGANRYYYLCLHNSLAFGGGGSFALYLEEDLLHGTSGPCETFGNMCLAHTEEFELKNVELWGFTHFSRYLI